MYFHGQPAAELLGRERCSHAWLGVEAPALFSRSDVGDMTKRKRTRKRSGQLVTKHPQKSPTCEATRSITWQSRPTTLLAPGPPAPQSTSPQRSHVSAPDNTRCSCLERFLLWFAGFLESEGAGRCFFAAALSTRLTSLFFSSFFFFCKVLPHVK